MVEALALLGDGAGPGVLAEVAGTDPAPALAAARRAGLLGAPTEDGTPFAHALLQDGVRAAVPRRPPYRSTSGRRARCPTGCPAGPPRIGGPPAGTARPPTARCARPSRPGGRSPSTTRSGTCRTPPTRWPPPVRATPRLAELLVRLATAEFVAGRIPDSAARSEAAADAATRAGRPDIVAQAALVLRGVTNPYVAPVVEALCRQALATEQPTAVRARLLAELAAMAAENGDPTEADRQAAEALRLAEQDGDPVAVLDAARARELTLLTADSVGERLRLGRLAIATAAEAGQPLSAVLGAGWQVRAGYQLARLDVVDEAFLVLGRVVERTGQPLARWHLERATAARSDPGGPVRAARVANQRAKDVAEALGDPTTVGMFYAHAGHLARLRGDRERPAGRRRSQFDVLAEEFRGAPAMPLVRASQAQAMLLLGRRTRRSRSGTSCGPRFDRMAYDFRWGGMVLLLADLAVSFGDGPARRPSSPRWPSGATARHGRHRHRVLLRLAAAEIGLLHATAGRPAEAAAYLRRAIPANQAVRGRPHVALCRLELAAVLRATGELDEAADLVRVAAAEFAGWTCPDRWPGPTGSTPSWPRPAGMPTR